MRRSFKKMLTWTLTASLALSSLLMPAHLLAAEEEGGMDSNKVVLEHHFEGGNTHGWAGRGAQVANSSDVSRNGESSLKVTDSSAAWNGANLDVMSDLQPGYTYEIEAYVRLADAADEPASLKATMQYGDSSYNQLVVNSEVTASSWAELKVEYEIPEDRTMLNLIIERSGDGATPDFYLDDVKITEVSAPPFDPVVVAAYDFEDGLQGWGPRGSPSVTQATYGYESDHSLYVEGRTSTWNGARISLLDKLKYGATYEVNAMVQLRRAEADPEVNSSEAMIKFETRAVGEDSSTTYPQVDAVVMEFGKWYAFNGEFTVDQQLQVLDLFVESADANDLIYLDEVTITQLTRETEIPNEPEEPEEPVDPGPIDPPVAEKDTLLLHTFEDGELNGWSGRLANDTAAISDADARSGSQSVFVEFFGQYHGAVVDVTDLMEEGVIYPVSVWVKLAPGEEDRSISLSYEQRLVGGTSTYHNIDGNRTVTDDGWVRLSGQFTAPANLEILNIYIETMDAADGALYLDDFHLRHAPPIRIQHDIPSLKDVFADYFDIGAAVEPYLLNGPRVELLNKHYNIIVAENSMKPGSIQPQEGVFNWTAADQLFAFAKENGFKVRFHTGLWHAQTANWMFQDSEGKSMAAETDLEKREANKQLLIDRLDAHIKAITDRYGDQIDSWDVVNEVISDGGGMRTNSPWWQIFGDDTFIREAFHIVRKYDPDGKLYINDYNTHMPVKRDTLYAKVQEWLDDGVPIDGVGHQTHIGLIYPPIEEVIESIRMFGELGLDNQITELDVGIYASDAEAFPEFDDVPAERYLEQAYRYRDLFDALKKLEDSAHAEGKDYISQLVWWGVADDYSWLHQSGRKNPPFVFDHRMQAKDAYWAIVDPSKLPVELKTVEVTQGSLEIDGERELAWDLASNIAVNSDEVTGHASFRALWDEDNLYVMAEVKDVTSSVYDQIDLFVADQQFTIKREDAGAVEGIDYALSEIDSGYLFEGKIPVEGLTVDQQLRFDIRVTDDALANPVSWNDYWHSQEENPDNLGILKLLGLKTKIYTAKMGTPEIDGDIDELWTGAETAYTDVWVEGNSGATADVRVLWDEDYLYVLAEVTDPLLSDSATNAHEQDSVEIFLDQNFGRTTSYQSDDGQYRVNFNNVQTYNGRASADNFTTVARVTDDGYIIEAAIKFDPDVAKDDAVLGFDVQVNDDADGDGTRDSVAIWSDYTGVSWSNTSNFGILTLSEVVAEPGDGEPGDGEPGDGEPGDGEPGDGEPGDGEPGDGEPGDGEPGDGEPGDGEPGDGEPGDGEPGDGEPGDGEPGDGEPGDGEPGDGEPGDGEPGDGEPGDGEPGDGEPGDGEPGDGEPGDGEPGDGEPGDGEPDNGGNDPGTGSPGDGDSGSGNVGDDETEDGIDIVTDNGSIELTVDGDKAGDTPIVIDEDTVQAALEGVENGVLQIAVGGAEGGLNAATIQLPLQSVVAPSSGVQHIDVNVGGALVSVAVNLPNGVITSESQTLTVSIETVDPNTLPSSVSTIVRGFPVYSFSLHVDGEPVERFRGQHAVRVGMDYTLQPGENPHHIIVYYVDEDGELIVVRNAKYDAGQGKIWFSPRHFSVYAGAYAPVTFNDTNQAAWAKEVVEAMAARDVVHGVGDGLFAPNRDITRAEFLQMLMNALDLVESGGSSSFSDVVPGTWYYDAVVSAEALGITQGKGDGRFGIADKITREDMAVLTHRAAIAAGVAIEQDLVIGFTDEDQISAYALQAVRELQRAGLIDGVGDGSFDPQGLTTRAAAASILYKLLGLN